MKKFVRDITGKSVKKLSLEEMYQVSGGMRPQGNCSCKCGQDEDAFGAADKDTNK